MALPPPMRSTMGAFYLVFGPMELSAGLGYTTVLGPKSNGPRHTAECTMVACEPVLYHGKDSRPAIWAPREG